MKIIFPGKSIKILFFLAAILLMSATNVCSEQPNAKMVLVQAVICEAIENFQPINPAVAFSISQGEVFCFSNFDPVFKKTYILHKWYKKDKLIFTMRLTLSPPKWSSFSRIQIRDADKGPWRVEIRDADDTPLQTLRFSMVD
ncbi:MAG: DUF2914 domain-containing protein [Desulfobacula sp.]|uniref:DUF2914 domain-containing protein n=1 Tax=Desulfobacula sp. TaxID=2593537 RepID=UPI0025BB1C10|nr:DUF2914 domain-containing protein [Desulfobacula sp.]MCD4718920.1 DUF2914 domain-containing protein [Desulfobacula sp.]